MPVKAALIGAGIFTRDVYARLFKANQERVDLCVVWSRSIESAESFIAGG